jgi:5-oxoprolinase (ATP-hydrolysing) subunit A
MTIDLNCDMGEGVGNDEQLMPYISSANIACGFHAGSHSTMTDTVLLAKRHGVAIGAHPSFPDRENFGRTNMTSSHRSVYELVAYQVNALKAIAQTHGSKLHHVKPHGALYNMAAIDHDMAEAIVSAINDLDKTLVLYGLAGSEMIKSARSKGLNCFEEAFADRSYQSNGTLTPRTDPKALIETEQEAVAQALQLIKSNQVRAINESLIAVHADSICIHGDGKQAIQFVKALNKGLTEEGIQISASR